MKCREFLKVTEDELTLDSPSLPTWIGSKQNPPQGPKKERAVREDKLIFSSLSPRVIFSSVALSAMKF